MCQGGLPKSEWDRPFPPEKAKQGWGMAKGGAEGIGSRFQVNATLEGPGVLGGCGPLLQYGQISESERKSLTKRS